MSLSINAANLHTYTPQSTEWRSCWGTWEQEHGHLDLFRRNVTTVKFTTSHWIIGILLSVGMYSSSKAVGSSFVLWSVRLLFLISSLVIGVFQTNFRYLNRIKIKWTIDWMISESNYATYLRRFLHINENFLLPVMESMQIKHGMCLSDTCRCDFPLVDIKNLLWYPF